MKITKIKLDDMERRILVKLCFTQRTSGVRAGVFSILKEA